MQWHSLGVTTANISQILLLCVVYESKHVKLSVVVVDFSESLSVVSQAVKQAEFLAIDAEFSGFVLLVVVH